VRGLEHLAELALTQLKEVLDAFATRSPDLANIDPRA
jgi:phosphate transport system protein